MLCSVERRAEGPKPTEQGRGAGWREQPGRWVGRKKLKSQDDLWDSCMGDGEYEVLLTQMG